MLALLYHKALCAVKGSLHVLLMLVPVLLSGCAALKYGSSSDVIIKSASGEAECVDITVSGKKSDAAYLNVTLPFTMKVKHDNLPLAVSVASKDNVYSDFAINAKRVGKTESALWLFCGGSVLGSGIVALALDGAYDVFDGDGYRNLAFIACGGALALYWGYLTKINVPERGEYSVAPVSPEDSCYARALLAKPVVHVMGEGEVRMERCGLVFSYKTDSDGKVCSLGTAEGLTVIGYDRGYSRIRKVACGKMCFYSVEKVVDGKTRYGACDMLGREIVPVKYKEKLKVFGGSIGVKAGKPITGLAEHVCGDEGNAKLGADFNEAALELAKRSRGTPRIANRLFKRVRDFALVEGNGEVDIDITEKALNRLQVDKFGLDRTDHELLLAIIERFNGGPVGIEALSSSIGEEVTTIEDVYEPYLLQTGLLKRTRVGLVM